MNKEDLEHALNEVNKKKNLIEKELYKLEAQNNEQYQKNLKREKKQYRAAMFTKDALARSVSDGSLKNNLDKVSTSLDNIKSVVASFSLVAEKAQEKMESNTAEIASNSLPSMAELWVPMLLNLLHSDDFQELMANMLIRMVS